MSDLTPESTPSPADLAAAPAHPDFTSPPPDRWAHRRAEPRPLAALWVCYLILCGVVSVGTRGAIGLASGDVYRAAMRLGLTLAGVGLAVLWPLLRLSQERPPRPRAATLADMVVIAIPLHMMIWPQCLPWMAAWPLDVAGLVATIHTAWVLIIGALLAVAARSPAPAWSWMLAILSLVIAAPTAAALNIDANPGAATNPWLLASPLSAVYEATRPKPWTGATAQVDAAAWRLAFLTLWVGVVAWVVLAVTPTKPRSRPAHRPTPA